MKRTAAWVGLTAVGVAVGFGVAMLSILVMNEVLPPFRPRDDDTWRDYGPALVAYALWGITSLAGAILAWHWVNRHVEGR